MGFFKYNIMKPYVWTNKYYGVFELKGDNTVSNKKAKRQESKNIIREGLYEHYVCDMAYFEDENSYNENVLHNWDPFNEFWKNEDDAYCNDYLNKEYW